MIIIGLTGGIASGKTTISNFLKKKRYAVHSSDDVVKKIYSKPTTSFINLIKKISLSAAIRGRIISKSIIRQEIFNHQNKKRKLEKFIHNEVRKSREQFIKKHKKKNTKIVILDIPLLFEVRLTHICDYVILVCLPRKLKIQRALARKGMKKNILLKILKNQLSDTYKKKKADFVINTSRTKNHSFKMILKKINNIMSDYA